MLCLKHMVDFFFQIHMLSYVWPLEEDEVYCFPPVKYCRLLLDSHQLGTKAQWLFLLCNR